MYEPAGYFSYFAFKRWFMISSLKIYYLALKQRKGRTGQLVVPGKLAPGQWAAWHSVALGTGSPAGKWWLGTWALGSLVKLAPRYLFTGQKVIRNPYYAVIWSQTFIWSQPQPIFQSKDFLYKSCSVWFTE
jgi:hypothetical protein